MDGGKVASALLDATSDRGRDGWRDEQTESLETGSVGGGQATPHLLLEFPPRLA
jgi:hypothetical protein